MATDWAKVFRHARDAQAVECAEHRRLVLLYPDLAKRLTMPPLDFRTPDLWHGYIPPRMIPVGGGMTQNDSAQRVHIVALVREAMARTYGGEVAATWLHEINQDRWSGSWTPHAAIERS